MEQFRIQSSAFFGQKRSWVSHHIDKMVGGGPHTIQNITGPFEGRFWTVHAMGNPGMDRDNGMSPKLFLFGLFDILVSIGDGNVSLRDEIEVYVMDSTIM